MAFDTDDVGTFLDLVQRLRTTEASRYTVRDTPSFTCIAMSLERALNALDGEPVALADALRARRLSAWPRAGVSVRKATEHLRASDPALARIIDEVGKLPSVACRAPRARRPLRRARALDRRPAAVGARGARDLRTSDRALRRTPADAAGDPRRRARRAARRGRAVAREGRLPALARRARALGRARARSAWTRCPTSEVIAELVAVKGLGVWTAHMFLMFHLDRPDVLADRRPRHPPGDRTRIWPSPRFPARRRWTSHRRALASAPDARLPLPVALVGQRARLNVHWDAERQRRRAAIRPPSV